MWKNVYIYEYRTFEQGSVLGSRSGVKTPKWQRHQIFVGVKTLNYYIFYYKEVERRLNVLRN